MQQRADKLRLVAEKAKQDKKWKFCTLAHHINPQSLAQSYKQLNKYSACGVDGVTVKEYGSNLENNIANLHARMKAGRYWPKPVKRVYIPKAVKNELRPLGLPAVEDKLVQMGLKEILEAIFEQDFLDCSHGFRLGVSCHTAVKELNRSIMHNPINWVVEVDIKKFFDTIDHNWLFEMLKQRISDPVFLGLIWRFLRAGIMEGSIKKPSDEGAPQGGIISPVLANIYLHSVLDRWFDERFSKQANGYVQLIRYCDDFVMVCEYEQDAKDFLQQLIERLAKFGLEIAPEKTRIIKFGRKTWNEAKKTGEKIKSFDFLGFTHYCKESRNGYFIVGHKTSRKRLVEKLKAFNLWLKSIRNMCPMKDWWKIVKAKVIGHYNYFGINGNIRMLKKFHQATVRICFKWMNRRSQKKSMNWEQFTQYLEWKPLPKPRICKKILYSMSD